MKQQLIKLILMATLLANGTFVYAAADKAVKTAAKTAKVTASKIVRISNPASNVGVQIGDVLHRTLLVTVKSDKKITPKSLPLKNTRTNGVELVDIKVTASEADNSYQYFIDLTYQVFSKASMPTELLLPQEDIRIIDTEKLVLPAWAFWYSPLVETTLSEAEKHVQAQDKSPLLNVQKHLNNLLAFGALLLAGLLGLFYINADANWLPWMGGNFAKAHRKIKRLSKATQKTGQGASEQGKTEQAEKALAAMHEAFNQTYGRNLFENEVAHFVAENQAFGKLTSEINTFFKRSNQALFTSASNTDNTALMQQLLSLSKQLRAIERGV